MNNQNQDNKNKNGRDPKGSQRIIVLVASALICLLFLSLIGNMFNSSSTDEVSYDEFLELLEDGKIDEVLISDYKISYSLKSDSNSSFPLYSSDYSHYTGRVDDPDITQKLLDAGVKINKDIPDTGSTILTMLLYYGVPIGIMLLVMSMLMKRSGGGGIMGVGKSNAKVYVQKETGVTFKDVAGQDEAKESLVEIVDFLHDPQKYVVIGAKLPKGALLVGPPGTGKTLLAKAVAGEAKVPFFSLSGSDFVEMFVGVGASRVRDLFKQAQQQAPCIVFIDEIDAIGKSRDTRFGGNDEREQTLNQLLAEMDGFDSSKGVFILAATNRPEVLDKALLRPGRLDRRIIVDKPDLRGRVDILKVHAKNVMLSDSVDLDAIALATSGAVGSDLANMINEAAINAVKHGRRAVNQDDLFEAVEVVLVGKEKKDRIMGEEERKIVSYHEVGHALVSALQKHSEPVQKITIVPRTMGALGYVMNVPEEEKFMNTKAELEAMLVQMLAGRGAEEIVFDTVTTGAANDIERATKIARAMVTNYGMSEEFGLMGLETMENQYLDGRLVQNCADETAAGVDKVVLKMLKDAYDEAKQLLSENRRELDEIASFLIEKETITGKEFMEILNRIRAEEGKPVIKSATKGKRADVKPTGKMNETGLGTSQVSDNKKEEKAEKEESINTPQPQSQSTNEWSQPQSETTNEWSRSQSTNEWSQPNDESEK